jgi:hypothetical protein
MKVRKMSCKSLKDKDVQTGLKIIYVFNKKRPWLLSLKCVTNKIKNDSRERLLAFIEKI